MTTHIRPLGSGDTGAVEHTVIAAGLFAPDDGPMLRELVAEHHDGAGGWRWVVAERAGEVVGTALCRPVVAADRVWDLTMIAVAPEHQGSGAGGRLMAHVESALRAARQRLLVVQTSGLDRFAATRAFYGRLGYVQRGHVPDYWADGDDLVLFAKPLGREEPGRNDPGTASLPT